MAGHTEGSWQVGPRNDDPELGVPGEIAILAPANVPGGFVAPAVALPFPVVGMAEANARRIVACVNACAGISTEALESVAREASHLDRLEMLGRVQRAAVGALLDEKGKAGA